MEKQIPRPVSSLSLLCKNPETLWEPFLGAKES